MSLVWNFTIPHTTHLFIMHLQVDVRSAQLHDTYTVFIQIEKNGSVVLSGEYQLLQFQSFLMVTIIYMNGTQLSSYYNLDIITK